MPTAAPAMNLWRRVSICPFLLHPDVLPSNHEHSHADSRSLQNTSNQGDNRTCSNSPLPAKAVGDDHIDDRTQDSTALEGGDDTTSDRTVGIVEVLDKLREGDDSSDDTRVITEQEASNSEEGTR
jgi:hypothetical protein